MAVPTATSPLQHNAALSTTYQRVYTGQLGELLTDPHGDARRIGAFLKDQGALPEWGRMHLDNGRTRSRAGEEGIDQYVMTSETRIVTFSTLWDETNARLNDWRAANDTRSPSTDVLKVSAYAVRIVDTGTREVPFHSARLPDTADVGLAVRAELRMSGWHDGGFLTYDRRNTFPIEAHARVLGDLKHEATGEDGVYLSHPFGGNHTDVYRVRPQTGAELLWLVQNARRVLGKLADDANYQSSVLPEAQRQLAIEHATVLDPDAIVRHMQTPREQEAARGIVANAQQLLAGVRSVALPPYTRALGRLIESQQSNPDLNRFLRAI